jgi:hypothetical protein
MENLCLSSRLLRAFAYHPLGISNGAFGRFLPEHQDQ